MSAPLDEVMSESVEASAANDHQVGGLHYRSEYQHWDFAERNGLGYLESAATKYVTRWRAKDGVEGLRKAIHYLQKLRELFAESVRMPKTCVSQAEIFRYCEANKLDQKETQVIRLVSTWSADHHLEEAQQWIEVLIEGSNDE